MHVPVSLLTAVAVSLVVVGCTDKAEPTYAKCVQLKGDVDLAWKACEEAVRMDPTTESGKAAATLLSAMKPEYDRIRTEREAAEAKASEERARRIAAARAEKATALRSRIQVKWFSAEPDSGCTGKGLPPYRWEYSGGTYAEDAQLAAADGCLPLYDLNGQNTDFCCSKKPFTSPF